MMNRQIDMIAYLHKNHRRPTRLELCPVSVGCSKQEYRYPALDGILVDCRVTSSSMSLVPIYVAGKRDSETMWSKVPCLRKQHDEGVQASNDRPS